MKRLLTLTVLTAVAACSGSTGSKPPQTSASVPAHAKPVEMATRSCVELNRIREARVVDDRTIDFYLGNREVLRNTLPQSCPQLGFEKAFTYSTSLSRLCSVDIITVIIQGGGPRMGASCGLGTFAPYSPVAK